MFQAVRPYFDKLQQIVDKMPEGSYIDTRTGEIKMEETEPKTDNDQLLDNYIQQVSDQQNQIADLQKTIMELREQTKQNQKDLIKKDLHHILNAEVDDIDDGTVDDIVDYILERENK